MPTLKEAVWKVLAEYAQMGLRQLQAEWQKALKEYKDKVKKAADEIWNSGKNSGKWKEIGYPRVPLAFFKDNLQKEKKPSVNIETTEFPPNFIEDLESYARMDSPKDVDPKGTPTRMQADPAMIKGLDLDKIFNEFSKKMNTPNASRVDVLYNLINKAIIEKDYMKMLKSLTVGGEGETAVTKNISKRGSIFASYDKKEAAYRVIKAYTATIG